MKPSTEWTESDLLELIQTQAEEHSRLEFKSSGALGTSDGKKSEVSKDISAFANSSGGVLVYGINESSDEPRRAESLSPIDPNLFSKEWLEQLINSRIQPRIQGVDLNSVALSSSPGNVAYVLSVPESSTAHQSSDRRYYKRFNFQSIAMEDYEIRQAMNRLSHAAYKARLKIEKREYPNGTKYFEISSGIENISELVGRDVSGVVFAPKHLVPGGDAFRLSIGGGIYTRIPGHWVLGQDNISPARDLHPLTLFELQFGPELSLPTLESKAPLRIFLRMYDQFGLALFTEFLVSLPSLEVQSERELQIPGVRRTPTLLSF
jgi:hypothetical protein